MVDKKENLDGIDVNVQQGPIGDERRKELLDVLNNIPSEEIDAIGDKLYYRKMVKKLKNGYNGNDLDMGLAIYLLDNGYDTLLAHKLGNFNNKNHREIIFKFIEYLGKKDSIDGGDIRDLELICKTIDKEMAILLIENGFWYVIARGEIPTDRLDKEVIDKIKARYNGMEEADNIKKGLKDLELIGFIESDRKDIALEIIKAGGEPDLNLIPKEDLTQDFATEILTIGTDHAYTFLSKNIKCFDKSIRKMIAIRYIEDGYIYLIKLDWLNEIKDKEILALLIEKMGSKDKWSEKELLRIMSGVNSLDKEILDKLVEKGYDLKNYSKILQFFSDKEKKYVALEIVKAGGEPDLNLIPKEDLTQNFAIDIFNIGTEHAYKFLTENINYFDELTQKVLALKYIEMGHRNYVDARWSDKIINCKEIAVSLINNGLESELMYRITCLDAGVINELKEKKYDLKKLENLLGCFIEKDMRYVALEIIKAGGEPNLNLMPKEDLTQDFAQEIINLKMDNGFKVISRDVRFFEPSLIKNIILNLIKASGLKYIKKEIIKTERFDKFLDKKFMLTILEVDSVTEAGEILGKFSNLDSEIASKFINAGKASYVVKYIESFNNLNDKIARSLLDEGYKAEILKNIERFNLSMFTKLRLLGKEKEKTKKINQKSSVPQDLMEFRKQWQDKPDLAIDDMKDEIIKAADKIPLEVKYQPDGSKIFTLKLKNRTLQILYPRLEKHTDDKYRDEIMFDPNYCSSFEFNNQIHKYRVKLGGMQGDISEWKNKKLKKFVKEKTREGFHIPDVDEMKDILSDLGETGGLDIDEEREDYTVGDISILTAFQMLLLMYVTGSPGWYWLSEGNSESSDNEESRPMMILSRFFATFKKHGYSDNDGSSASILMVK